jgi:cytochrome b561
MILRDAPTGYGLVTRLLHWVMAAGIIGLFVLGWWMVELDYYSPYYTSAPQVHKSLGMVLLVLLVARFLWRLANPRVDDSELAPLERRLAPLVHWGFYPLMLVLMVSGYLIPTADGQPIDVFGVVSVPAVLTGDNLEDTAGLIHKYSAYVIMIVALLHTAAALKHHFCDKSSILTRMWSGSSRV